MQKNNKNPLKSLFENDKFKALKAEYGYLALCFATPAVIMLLIYFALGHEPIADGSVLVLDLNAQYVYFYEALRDFIWGDGSLLYSFSRSLGGEFMGIYAYYIASPLSYIVAIFPKTMILEALLAIMVIKTGLCGLSFGYYLHKHSDSVNKFSVIIFSAMYALSAYAIVYQNNIMWIDALFWLPILTYGIERLIKRGRFKLFVISLAVMMMSHYYIGYMLCWYVFFCFFFTYFKDSDRTLINPLCEKRHFIKSLLRIGAFSALAIGISAFMIGAAYYSLQFGKNTFTDPDWSLVARFDFLDLLPKLLPGAYDTVMHEGLPLLYCGVLTLFMLPIYFMAKKVTYREKIFYASFILLYVLIMTLNPLDLVMHGFQEPNCLNYRYSFIVIFLMLFIAYKGFCELRNFSPKVILGVGAALIFTVFVLQKFEYPNFMLQDGEYFEYGYVLHKLPLFQVILLSILVIFVIGAVLCYYVRSKKKQLTSAILLGAVCLELFGNGMVLMASLGCDVGFSSYSSYVDYFKDLRPIVDTVKESDEGFYRMEKTSHRCTNDNMALGIKGLSNSTSTLNAKVISMLDYLGYYSDSHWTQYKGGAILADSLFGIKYVVSNTENEYNKETLALNAVMDKYYELYDEDEYYYAYKNPYALSFAYGVSSEIKDLDISFEYDYTTNDGLKNPFEVQNMLLNAMLGDIENTTEYYKPIHLNRVTDISKSLSTVGGGMEYSANADPDDEEDLLEFTFIVETTGPLYMFIPSGYERKFTIFMNGEQYVDSGDYSRIICLGLYEKGEDVTVSLRLDERNLYFFKNTDYFYSLDVKAFENAISTLAQTNYEINEKSSDSHIVGTLATTEENQMIFTTIPYDAGWIVKVDGKATETYATLGDTLLAFDIEDTGEHTVEMIYMPKIYVIGGIISIVSVAIFVTLSVFESRKRKKKAHQNNAITTGGNE